MYGTIVFLLCTSFIQTSFCFYQKPSLSSVIETKSNLAQGLFGSNKKPVWKIHKYTGIELKPVSNFDTKNLAERLNSKDVVNDIPPAAIRVQATVPPKQYDVPIAPKDSYGPPETSGSSIGKTEEQSALEALSQLGESLPDAGIGSLLRLYNDVSASKRNRYNSLDYQAVAAQKNPVSYQAVSQYVKGKHPLRKIQALKTAKANALRSGVGAISNYVSSKIPTTITESVTYKNVPVKSSYHSLLGYVPFVGNKVSSVSSLYPEPFISGFGKIPATPNLPRIKLPGKYNIVSGKNSGYVSIKAPSKIEPPVYSAPAAPVNSYEAPTAPLTSYGAPAAPPNSYGPPTAPSNSYGPPAAPSNSYGPPSAPSNSYGPPAAPSNSYGPPAAPSNSYGPPAAPSNSYGPPAAPSISYEAPPAPLTSYGIPASQSSSYSAPAASHLNSASYYSAPQSYQQDYYTAQQPSYSPNANVINVPPSAESGPQYYSFPQHSDYVVQNINNGFSSDASFAASDQFEEWQPSNINVDEYYSQNNSADKSEISGAIAHDELPVESNNKENENVEYISDDGVVISKKNSSEIALRTIPEVKHQPERKFSQQLREVPSSTEAIDVTSTIQSEDNISTTKRHNIVLENLKNHARARPSFLRSKETTTEVHLEDLNNGSIQVASTPSIDFSSSQNQDETVDKA